MTCVCPADSADLQAVNKAYIALSCMSSWTMPQTHKLVSMQASASSRSIPLTQEFVSVSTSLPLQRNSLQQDHAASALLLAAFPLLSDHLRQPGHGQLDVAYHGADDLRLRHTLEQVLLSRCGLRCPRQQVSSLQGALSSGKPLLPILHPHNMYTQGTPRTVRQIPCCHTMWIETAKTLNARHQERTQCCATQRLNDHILPGEQPAPCAVSQASSSPSACNSAAHCMARTSAPHSILETCFTG